MATPEVPGRVSPRPAASRITAKESTLIDFLNKDSGLRLEKKRLAMEAKAAKEAAAAAAEDQ